MDKNIIKKHLTQTFVNEAKNEAKSKERTPGISVTNAANKESGKINKDGVEDIDNKLKAYDDSLKNGMKTTKTANKFNYNSIEEEEYHKMMEIENGQTQIQYDRKPNAEFEKRALQSLEGNQEMGNKGGEEMGNAQESWGASSDDFGNKLAKNAKDSFNKRMGAEIKYVALGNDMELRPEGEEPMGKHSAYESNNKNNNNKAKIKEGMKRLNFKKEFNGVGNALKMIPESYRVDNKTFEMTDGVENYKIRWEGTLTEGRAIVLMASDKTMVNEDMAHMKHLMGYKSNETLGLVKGKARLDENKMFTDIWTKTRDLMEGEDIESVKAKTGNLEDIKKKAPEATKHVQGSVSKDKGTQAPAAKEGDLDDAVSHAPEAKKHVEGSASTEKGTKAPAPKNGNWEDVKKKSADATKHVTLKESLNEEDDDDTDEDDMPEAPSKEKTDAAQVTETEEIESVKVGEKNWDKITVPHAQDAKKDIHMFKGGIDEGVKIGENFFAPLSEEMDDYDVDVKKKDKKITEGIYEEEISGEENVGELVADKIQDVLSSDEVNVLVQAYQKGGKEMVANALSQSVNEGLPEPPAEGDYGMSQGELKLRQILDKLIMRGALGSLAGIIPAAMMGHPALAVGLGIAALAGTALKDAAWWKNNGHHYGAQDKYGVKEGMYEEGETWDRDSSHRDTYGDTAYEDNWDEHSQEQDEFVVYVEKDGEMIPYSRYGYEEEAAAEVEKLASIGVKARY